MESSFKFSAVLLPPWPADTRGHNFEHDDILELGGFARFPNATRRRTRICGQPAKTLDQLLANPRKEDPLEFSSPVVAKGKQNLHELHDDAFFLNESERRGFNPGTGPAQRLQIRRSRRRMRTSAQLVSGSCVPERASLKGSANSPCHPMTKQPLAQQKAYRMTEERRVAMILAGGIGLGAYQAGAYAQLHQREALQPAWLAGSSIGSINTAVIAGNPAESRVQSLHSLWQAGSQFFGAAGDPTWSRSFELRRTGSAPFRPG